MGEIYDASGRYVAPAQHEPEPRPRGPWDQNGETLMEGTPSTKGGAYGLFRRQPSTSGIDGRRPSGSRLGRASGAHPEGNDRGRPPAANTGGKR